MEEGVGLLFGLAMLPAILAAFIGIGRWIVVPLDRAAKGHKAPMRFSIGDFLCLFLAVQIPLAAIHVLVREEERRVFWVFTVITWIVGPVIWYVCTQALSKAGVSHGRHRVAFLGVVLPIVYYGLFPFVFLPVMGVAAAVNGDSVPLSNVGGLVALWVTLGMLLALSGLYTRWLVRQVGMEPEIAAGGDNVGLDE